MALKAYDNIQFFLPRHLGSVQHALDSRRIGGHRFFNEPMLALFYHFFKMNGAETGRSRKDYDVGECDRLFVTVESNEFIFFFYRDAVFHIARSAPAEPNC